MSNVIERVVEIQTGLQRLRGELPRDEWKLGAVIQAVTDLCGAIRELGLSTCDETPQTARPNKDRKSELDKLLWMAVKALPPGTGPDQRDELIRHVLASWHVSDRELATLGYGKA